MATQHIIIQAPQGPASSLLLLFHGVGSSPRDLQGLGQLLATLDERLYVVSVASPWPSDFGQGYQWFSVQGVTEENRPARIAAVMPAFVETVHHWQQQAGVDARATLLLGFSQGGIMALESLATESLLARAVIALAGRFAQLPISVQKDTRVYLVHGQSDPVINSAYSQQAQARIQQLGGQAQLTLIPGLAHGIDQRAAQAVRDAVSATLKAIKTEAL